MSSVAKFLIKLVKANPQILAEKWFQDVKNEALINLNDQVENVQYHNKTIAISQSLWRSLANSATKKEDFVLSGPVMHYLHLNNLRELTSKQLLRILSDIITFSLVDINLTQYFIDAGLTYGEVINYAKKNGITILQQETPSSNLLLFAAKRWCIACELLLLAERLVQRKSDIDILLFKKLRSIVGNYDFLQENIFAQIRHADCDYASRDGFFRLTKQILLNGFCNSNAQLDELTLYIVPNSTKKIVD